MKIESSISEAADCVDNETRADAVVVGARQRRPFVEPELLERGDLTDVTAGAFGTMSPSP